MWEREEDEKSDFFTLRELPKSTSWVQGHVLRAKLI